MDELICYQYWLIPVDAAQTKIILSSQTVNKCISNSFRIIIIIVIIIFIIIIVIVHSHSLTPPSKNSCLPLLIRFGSVQDIYSILKYNESNGYY